MGRNRSSRRTRDIIFGLITILLPAATSYGILLPSVPTQFQDEVFYLYDNADATKIAEFEASGITTGNTRTFTFPDLSGTLLCNLAEDTSPQLGGDLYGQSLYDVNDMVDGIFSGTVQAGTLTDGTFSVTGGTISAGTWQGSFIAHEYGGLEADVSGYNGLLKISGGTTSQITDSSSNWDAAYTHVSNNGSDHSYINQDVTTSGTPTFGTVAATTGSFTSVLNGDGLVGSPSYTFTNDGNTGMWLSASNILNFSTNGAERLEIDSSEATFTIPISSTGSVTGNSLVTGGLIGISGDTDIFRLSSALVDINADINFPASTTNIDYGDGGVTDYIEFTGNATYNGFFLKRDDAANQMYLLLSGTAAAWTTDDSLNFTSSNESIGFTASTAGKEITLTSPVINISASTGVGIGTSSPDTTLQVVGSGGFGDDSGNETLFGTNGDQSFAGTAGFYPRRINQSAEPVNGTGSTQVDVGELLIWRDSDDGKIYLVYNDTDSGVVTVELP